jgi:aryl-alcohol dehydrogenase (NADP+)
MEHVRLGRTGLKVSRLCLGTMTFGLQCDEETSVAILDRAAAAGVTFLDTADAYPLGAGFDLIGRTEEILGRWLRGRRDDFVVATKASIPTGPLPFQGGNARRHVVNAAEASLRRLQTDYIDPYQLHRYDPETPVEETLAALDDLVRAGKVRYVGCSNWLAYQVARALGHSEARALERFASVQPRYNLLFREFERDLLPLCEEEGLGVIPYNPLAGGLLSGKHDPERGPAEGTRFTLTEQVGGMYRDRYWDERAFEAVSALGQVSRRAGLALPTLAVAWVLAHPAVTSPIVGASRPEQLEATLAAADTRLDETILAELDGITRQFRWGDAPR